MIKFLKYLILLPIVYVISIWMVNTWDTWDVSPDLLKMKVLKVEYGEYGEWYDEGLYYDTRLTTDNKKMGYVYVNRKFLSEKSTPKKFVEGKEYVGYVTILEAHSWADVFKYGSKYDYYVSSFVDGQLGSYNADDIYKKELESQAGVFENLLYAIIGIGAFAIWFILLYFIDQRVYKNVKEKNGQYLFNKPAWLEFLTALGYSLGTVFYLVIAIDFFTYGSWFYGVIFALMTLYDFSRVAKEFIDRNDEIRISAEKIIVQDGNNINEIGKVQITAIEIEEKTSDRGKLEEFTIRINKEDGSSYSYDLVRNNLHKYASVVKETLQNLYKDKMPTKEGGDEA